MRSRLEIVTDGDDRHTIQTADGDPNWKSMLIGLINSASSALVSESGDSPHIRSRLKLTTDGGDSIMESEGATWARVMIRFIEDFSVENRTQPGKVAVKSRSDSEIPLSEPLSVRERLESFLKYEYPNVWFTSMDIKKQYGRVYDPINLSTVSTYLARMYNRDILERRGNRTQREYRVRESEVPERVLPIMQSVN
ncbi:MAG: hypothetical protein U9N07_03245 [Euryarchaeota archaeon]|nr:hypothetical protein [Euryarchaeota archaeon]